MSSIIQWLQDWTKSQIDGDWEHELGISISMLRQFGIRICLEKFQLPTLFNAHWQCLRLILEEIVCCQCRTEIHEEVMYGAMA